MNLKSIQKTYNFDCGCSFPMLDEKNFSLVFDIEKLRWDCSRVWDLLSKGLTKGVFQLESHLGRTWTKKLKPENIEHLAALGAILRPGALRQLDDKGISTTDHYCLRKNNLEPVMYYHPVLESALKGTFGLMIYQEQAMKIAEDVAKFNPQQADELRKSIGKKLAAEMSKVKIKFIEGCTAAGIVNTVQAEEIFSWIRESQRYSFNRSHAVSYAINGYLSAFCKAHFPLQFFTSWLFYANDSQHPKTEMRELINEAKLMNIEVFPPDVTKFEPNFYTDGKVVNFGLVNIKGMGDASVKKVLDYITKLPDFTQLKWHEVVCQLVPKLKASVMTKLVSVGAFSKFDSNRTRMLKEIEMFAELSGGQQKFLSENINKFENLLAGLRQTAKLKKEGGGTHSESDKPKINSIISMLENPPSPLEDSANWIAGIEDIMLGISITCSRIDACDTSAINTTCKDFMDGKDNGCLILGVEIQDYKELKTRKGKEPGRKMCKVVISDGTCSVDAVCFPESYQEFGQLLTKDNTVIIQGYKDKKQGGLIISKVWQAENLNNGGENE